jgi:hypothetical protein
MKKLLLFLCALVAYAAWSPYRSKEHFRFASRLTEAPSLALQCYHVGLMNNLTSMYLTDSTRFRLYLGTFDEESEIIHVQVEGDQVVVYKASNYRHDSEPPPIHETIYSLAKLRQEHAFE